MHNKQTGSEQPRYALRMPLDSLRYATGDSSARTLVVNSKCAAVQPWRCQREGERYSLSSLCAVTKARRRRGEGEKENQFAEK